MQRFTFVILILLIAAGLLLPASAHAGFLDAIGESTKSVSALILDIGSNLVEIASQLLVRVIAFLGNSLQDIISFKPTYGGATVFQLWKWLRDLCNMLFIVVLVAIAFGTIFNTIKPTAFHARQSLALFIVAAILINASLAVGQTIVWVGNKATDVVLGFMPNVGAQLADSLKIIGVETGDSGLLVQPPPSTATTSLEQLSPAQRAEAEGWLGIVGGSITSDSATRTAAQNALNQLQTCLLQNRTVDECWRAARLQHTATLQGVLERDRQAAEENTLLLRAATITSRAVYGKDSLGFSYGEQSELGKSLARFGGLLVRLFLLLVLTLSFVAITIFMVARIPAIWFLLAFSGAAFFALAVPPMRSQFSVWLKNIVGMSLFGPLYLMVIYIGLFVLSTQGSLVASGNNINDIPFVSTVFGTAFFYVVASGIFIGGALQVTKFAFSLSPTAGSLFGAIGGRLGVTPESQFGIRTVARGLGTISMANRAARGVQEGARERYARVIQKPLKERGERFEAGVRTLVAGGEARQKYLQSRVDERTKKLDKQLQDQTSKSARRLEQAHAAVVRAESRVERERSAGTLGKGAIQEFLGKGAIQELNKALAANTKAEEASGALKKSQEEKLRALLQKSRRLPGGNETAVAAGNQLLKLQKITPQELAELQERYAKISPAALQGFIQQRNTQLQKDARTRKYADANEVRDFLQLIGDKKEATAFVNAAKTSKNKFSALVAGAGLGLITDADNNTLDANKVIEREAHTFNAADMLKAEQYYHQAGAQRPKELEERYIKLLRQTRSYSEMLANAKADQLARITEAKDRAIKEVVKLNNKIRKLRTDINEGRKAEQDVSDLERQLDELLRRQREFNQEDRQQTQQRGAENQGNQTPPPQNNPNQQRT